MHGFSVRQEISWQPTYAAAMQAASTSGKLILVDFYNDWWVYCKRMDEVTLKDPTVIKEVSRFLPVKVNGEKEGAELAAERGVTGYPTILLMDHEGKSVGQISGFQFPEQFVDHLELIVDAHLNADRYESRLKKDPADTLDAERLAAIYAMRGSIKPALSLLGTALEADPKNSKGELAHALNAVGDFYAARSSNTSKTTAASYYQRALDAAKSLAEQTYSAEKLAECYMATGEPALAVAPLKQILALDGLSPEEKSAVQTMLDSAAKETGG
jgi:thioredoxin-related protein